MHTHSPADYECPFCPLVNGKDHGYNKQQDIVYRNEYTTAFVSPKWWVSNPGNVLVISNEHYENIYDIPEDLLAEVYKTVQKIAVAIRETYGCNGTSTRQHNEPEGGQGVWHVHVHVFPRYKDDNLYQNHEKTRWTTGEEKIAYVNKLKEYLSRHTSVQH